MKKKTMNSKINGVNNKVQIMEANMHEYLPLNTPPIRPEIEPTVEPMVIHNKLGLRKGPNGKNNNVSEIEIIIPNDAPRPNHTIDGCIAVFSFAFCLDSSFC
jgi:hypothetical protein